MQSSTSYVVSAVIHGQESAFANQDTLAVTAIDNVPSCITGLGAEIYARVKILRTVTMSMERASAAQVGLVSHVASLVQRADTGLGVNRSANVKTGLHVIQPMENVIVLQVGQVRRILISKYITIKFPTKVKSFTFILILQVFTVTSPAQRVTMARTVERSVTAESLDSVTMCTGSVSADPGPGGSTASWTVPQGDTGSTVTPAVTVIPSTALGVTRSLESASVDMAGGATSVTQSVRRGDGEQTAAWTVGVEEALVITKLESARAGQDIRGIPALTLAHLDILALTVFRNVPCAIQVSEQFKFKFNFNATFFALAVSVCDPVSGGCGCAPGFTGYYCIDPCPEGTWGPQCRHTCHCRKGACHHVTGECVCPGGWTGATCEVPCADGSYGPGCEHTCHCLNDAKCNPVEGRCHCRPGYRGNR